MQVESILCECSQELSIHAGVCCLTCNREIYTRKELQQQSSHLSMQIHALRMEQAKIDIELFQRKEHHPSRKHLLYEDFFKGVRKAPRGEKGISGTIRDYKAEAKFLLEEL